MTALSRSIGNSIFDSNLVFDKRERGTTRVEDGLRNLQQSFARTTGTQRGAAAVDFLRSAPPSGARSPVQEVSPSSFAIIASQPSAISISSLATAASARSGGFGSVDDEVTAGTLSFEVKGASYGVTIAQGATLKDVVSSIRALNTGVDATIERDGAQFYLQLKNKTTGYTISEGPDSALTISETATGTSGQRLAAQISNVATNAVFSMNGVTQVRTQNLVTDALSGTSVDLAKISAGISPAVAPDRFSFGSVKNDATGSRYLVAVESLARPAEVRSSLYGSENDAVRAGTFSLAVEGRRFAVTVNEGDTLSRVRERIEGSGADVSAKIVSDSGGVRLSITSRQKGYPLRGTPADALSVSGSTGRSGQALGPSVSRVATNAVVKVNGTATTSRSDNVTGAVPGFTLSLKKVSSEGELITVANGGRRNAVNVDNEVNRLLQAQLLTTRGIAAPVEEEKLNQVKQKAETTEKTQQARNPTTGGNESSRADILNKLTAVDGIFGGLRSASQFLAGLSAGAADAQ